MIVDDILDSISVVSELGQYLPVNFTPRDGENRINCPLSEHSSLKTFTFNQSAWNCHACGTGGNVINLVAQLQRISIPRAISFLAKRIKNDRPTTTAELDAWRERQMERAADRQAAERCDYLAICGACGRTAQLRGKHYPRGDWTSAALLEGLCRGWKLGERKIRCPGC